MTHGVYLDTNVFLEYTLHLYLLFLGWYSAGIDEI